MPDCPGQDPKDKQGGLAADLPTWLPLGPSQTSRQSSPESSPEASEDTSEDGPVETPQHNPLNSPLHSPVLSPLRIPLLSPLHSPPALPQPHPPRLAPPMDEAQRKKPRGLSTPGTLPPAAVSCRVVPRWRELGSKQTKHPAPASTRKAQETCAQDNTPPKKKKKMGMR